MKVLVVDGTKIDLKHPMDERSRSREVREGSTKRESLGEMGENPHFCENEIHTSYGVYSPQTSPKHQN